MYLPWLLYFVPRQPLEPGESYFEFPFGLILIFLGLLYLLAAIALSTRLYRRRELSRAHRLAFYASLGLLMLFATLLL